jgi:hypothetical protein
MSRSSLPSKGARRFAVALFTTVSFVTSGVTGAAGGDRFSASGTTNDDTDRLLSQANIDPGGEGQAVLYFVPIEQLPPARIAVSDITAGRVVFTSPPSLMTAFGLQNDGYVNFVVNLASGTRVGAWSFSRTFDPASREWVGSAEDPTILLHDSGRSAPQGIYPCSYSYVRDADAFDDVGEGHSVNGLTGIFSYTTKADTDASTGISYDHGSSWGINGSIHIGNSVSYTRGQAFQDEFGYRLQSSFNHVWWDYNCAGATPSYQFSYLEVGRWNGSARHGDDIHFLDHRCQEDHSEYIDVLHEGDYISRMSSDFVTFSGAITAWGFSGRMQSGASTTVTLYLASYDGSHNICGDTDYPIRAKRILAGG